MREAIAVAHRAVCGLRRGAEGKRLLAFARRQELRPEAVDVQRLTESMAEMLPRSLGPTIQIDMSFDPDLALISVDPNQLELAILNLALLGLSTVHGLAVQSGGGMRLRPGLPVILATGYADFPNSNVQDLPRLSKPFGAHELATILATLGQRSLAS
jgi:hypothetical protein